MKAKTIKAVISKKIKQWTDSITDQTVRELVEKNTIVTGGAIASMLLKEDVNDFDIYFRNKETTKAVAEYYVAQHKASAIDQHLSGRPIEIEVKEDTEGRIKVFIKSAGITSDDGTTSYQYFETQPDEATENYVNEITSALSDVDDLGHQEEEKQRYRPVFMTANAITLSDKIQLINRFYGEPDQIHENYDFVHCTNYWTSWNNELVLRPDALEALLSKDLRYIGSKYPLCSIIRLRKFIKRNWSINAGQILKICMQLSQLDLTNLDVLEDQLIGVDTAYFLQLIQQLKEKNNERVDYNYLMTIIDRIF